MRTKKLLLILALLCTIVQGTRAQNFDVWDGHTTTEPSQIGKHGGYSINSAAELAYIREHWDEETGWEGTDKVYHWCDTKYSLTTNIDMGNTLYYPTDDGFKVNACRGYFRLKSLTAGEPTNSQQAGVRAFKLNFGDDDNATGIEEIDNLTIHNSQFEAGAWFTLDGRKLSGKPATKGIFIRNGKKMLVR